jgi:putative DNA primase/helicase
MRTDIDFRSLIGPVVRKLLGEPNQHLSSKSTLRFGNHGSLAVEVAGEQQGTWFDYEHNEGGGLLALLLRQAGLEKAEALNWIHTECGADICGLSEWRWDRDSGRRTVATYDYRDASGKLLFEVVRYEPKDFRQRRPDGSGGRDWTVRDMELVPYHLPQLIETAHNPARSVYIVEGEKDVHTVEGLGLVAICNSGGAGPEPKADKNYNSKWPSAFGQYFVGRDVIILPDNDAVGEAHARAIAKALIGTAARIRIVNLPGLAHKQDVSDWMAAGGTLDQLIDLVALALDFNAEPPANPHSEPASNEGQQIWQGRVGRRDC